MIEAKQYQSINMAIQMTVIGLVRGRSYYWNNLSLNQVTMGNRTQFLFTDNNNINMEFFNTPAQAALCFIQHAWGLTKQNLEMILNSYNPTARYPN